MAEGGWQSPPFRANDRLMGRGQIKGGSKDGCRGFSKGGGGKPKALDNGAKVQGLDGDTRGCHIWMLRAFTELGLWRLWKGQLCLEAARCRT